MPRKNNRKKQKRPSQYYEDRRLDILRRELIKSSNIDDKSEITSLEATKKDRD